jgi:hypothetical protein
MSRWLAPPWNCRVCCTCGELRGSFLWRLKGIEHSHAQECGCQRRSRGDAPRPETWLGFDFNTVVELCRACGCQVLNSGSRYSVWFCSTCKHRAITLNTETGQPLVPIGRHSLMHGIAMRARPTDAKIRFFVTRFGTLVDRMDHIDKWAGEVVRTNLAAVGLSDALDIELALYLDAVRDVDRAERFEAMVTSLTLTG